MARLNRSAAYLIVVRQGARLDNRRDRLLAFSHGDSRRHAEAGLRLVP